MNINKNEREILSYLVECGEDYSGFCFFCFDALTGPLNLDRKQVRRACRSLARKGLTEFGRGLWSEDGAPAGSGYCATRGGKIYLEEHPSP